MPCRPLKALNNTLLISGSRVRAPHGPLGAKPTSPVHSWLLR
nr:MAG TPA: hypothetical protein [Caudoviricetes sp.]